MGANILPQHLLRAAMWLSRCTSSSIVILRARSLYRLGRISPSIPPFFLEEKMHPLWFMCLGNCAVAHLNQGFARIGTLYLHLQNSCLRTQQILHCCYTARLYGKAENLFLLSPLVVLNCSSLNINLVRMQFCGQPVYARHVYACTCTACPLPIRNNRRRRWWRCRCA